MYEDGRIHSMFKILICNPQKKIHIRIDGRITVKCMSDKEVARR